MSLSLPLESREPLLADVCQQQRHAKCDQHVGDEEEQYFLQRQYPEE